MKYEIKNCDNYTEFDKDWTCRSTIQNRKGCFVCQDCTDCVLKQIVGLCKRTCRMRCTNDCLGTKKHCGYGQILKLLDIQECEND